MPKIRGVSVILLTKTQTGTDPLGMPEYGTMEETVDDVLVGQPTSEDLTSALELYGKKIDYMMALPKGDSHNWENAEVILPEPFAGKYRTVGIPTSGIEANIPLRWNRKVKLERCNDE